MQEETRMLMMMMNEEGVENAGGSMGGDENAPRHGNEDETG